MRMDIVKTQEAVSKYSNWLMVTTSVHHIYGAYIYDTPERLHVLAISIPVMVLTYFFDGYFRKKAPPHKKIMVLLYAMVILVPSLLLIGVLEGVYNHILKNILFFSNVPEDTIINSFYYFYDDKSTEMIEMPNDAIFELTGIAQGLLVIPLAIQFIRYISAQLSMVNK